MQAWLQQVTNTRCCGCDPHCSPKCGTVCELATSLSNNKEYILAPGFDINPSSLRCSKFCCLQMP